MKAVEQNLLAFKWYPVLFIMLYTWYNWLQLLSPNKIAGCPFKTAKASEQYFRLVLFIILFKVASLTIQSVNVLN